MAGARPVCPRTSAAGILLGGRDSPLLLRLARRHNGDRQMQISVCWVHSVCTLLVGFRA